ncbi:hypothetical protein PIB30_005414 [Stylosanthes scabra]|uniref:Uncharacterized protein n=1 Tax=Stylosanthes scabra TaxID=79078 RepID=A0ABU6X404_9FABA|nr:hypothetical protein [Stylosanthes scabra]
MAFQASIDDNQRRFVTTRSYWPNRTNATLKFPISQNQTDIIVPSNIVQMIKSPHDNLVWIIDQAVNCLEFYLKKEIGLTWIRGRDLNKINKIYQLETNFKMELTYVDWGVFYFEILDANDQPIKIDSSQSPDFQYLQFGGTERLETGTKILIKHSTTSEGTLAQASQERRRSAAVLGRLECVNGAGEDDYRSLNLDGGSINF